MDAALDLLDPAQEIVFIKQVHDEALRKQDGNVSNKHTYEVSGVGRGTWVGHIGYCHADNVTRPQDLAMDMRKGAARQPQP
jgi:hypothetical protein